MQCVGELYSLFDEVTDPKFIHLMSVLSTLMAWCWRRSFWRWRVRRHRSLNPVRNIPTEIKKGEETILLCENGSRMRYTPLLVGIDRSHLHGHKTANRPSPSRRSNLSRHSSRPQTHPLGPTIHSNSINLVRQLIWHPNHVWKSPRPNVPRWKFPSSKSIPLQG